MTTARARNRGRKDPKGKLIALYPTALERRYQKTLDARLKDFADDLLSAFRKFDRTRQDANLGDMPVLLAILERVGIAHETEFIAQGPGVITQLGTALNQWQDRQVSRYMGDVIGIDPRKIRNFLGKRTLAATVNRWATDNVRIIQNVESDLLTQVGDAIADGLVQGQSTEEIAERISERGRVGRSRARLVARDQLATLNHKVTRTRQETLGITEYRWITSMDERVRPEHAERNQKIFAWSSPPEDGHPGEAINCRCVATPIVPEDLDLFR